MDAETQSTDIYIRTIEWLNAKRKVLLIAGIVVVVVGLACAVLAWKKAQDASDANAQFFSASTQSIMRGAPVSTSPLVELAREYPGTAAGEHARILAAEGMFGQGQYPEAYQQFTDFVAAYPDSALVPEAKVGIAASLEAEGKTSEAITKYHEIILAYPTEMNIVSPAKLTLARLYEEEKQPQEALTYYAELARMLKQNPYDPWAAEAQERAQLLVSKHPELLKALQQQNAPPSSPTSGFSLPPTAKPPAAAAPLATPNSTSKP